MKPTRWQPVWGRIPSSIVSGATRDFHHGLLGWLNL